MIKLLNILIVIFISEIHSKNTYVNECIVLII